MKNKYKVEIEVTTTYIVDVLANTEDEARLFATNCFDHIKDSNTEHYHQEGDTIEEIGTIYDVTNTDDPFSPVNDLINETNQETK